MFVGIGHERDQYGDAKAMVSTMEITTFAKNCTPQKGDYRDQKKG